MSADGVAWVGSISPESSRHDANSRDAVGSHGRPVPESLQAFQAPSRSSGLHLPQDVQKQASLDVVSLLHRVFKYTVYNECTVRSPNLRFCTTRTRTCSNSFHSNDLNTAPSKVEVTFTTSRWPSTLHDARIWRVRGVIRSNPVD